MAVSQVNEQFRHAELTKAIIGTFYEVYNELGHGFIESVYENSLTLALRCIGQLMNYLKATQIEVGLVLNFGPRPEFKRVVFGNERKNRRGEEDINSLSASSA